MLTNVLNLRKVLRQHSIHPQEGLQPSSNEQGTATMV